MRKTKRDFGCPVEFSIDLLSGKWKTVILSRLKLRPMRYGELRQDIPALSDKVLTERLRDLCEAGFVKQERFGGASRYCLTKRGEMLKPMLRRFTNGVMTMRRRSVSDSLIQRRVKGR
jgi:DNA-binding HxlR family transcriptional regulator